MGDRTYSLARYPNGNFLSHLFDDEEPSPITKIDKDEERRIHCTNLLVRRYIEALANEDAGRDDVLSKGLVFMGWCSKFDKDSYRYRQYAVQFYQEADCLYGKPNRRPEFTLFSHRRLDSVLDHYFGEIGFRCRRISIVKQAQIYRLVLRAAASRFPDDAKDCDLAAIS